MFNPSGFEALQNRGAARLWSGNPRYRCGGTVAWTRVIPASGVTHRPFWEAHAVVKFTQLVALVLVGCAAAAFALAQDEEPVPPAGATERDESLIDDRGPDRAAKPG